MHAAFLATESQQTQLRPRRRPGSTRIRFILAPQMLQDSPNCTLTVKLGHSYMKRREYLEGGQEEVRDTAGHCIAALNTHHYHTQLPGCLPAPASGGMLHSCYRRKVHRTDTLSHTKLGMRLGLPHHRQQSQMQRQKFRPAARYRTLQAFKGGL